MLRGIISGAFFGTIVAAVILAIGSLISEQPPGNAPPEPPQVNAPAPAAGDTGASLAPVDPATAPDQPSLPDVPEVATPLGDTEAPLADTTSASVPELADLQTGMAAPETGEAPVVASPAETSSPSTAGSVAPPEPSPEPGPVPGLTVSTEPAQPAPPLPVAQEPEPVAPEDAEPVEQPLATEASTSPTEAAPAEPPAPAVPDQATLPTEEPEESTDAVPPQPAAETVTEDPIAAAEAPEAEDRTRPAPAPGRIVLSGAEEPVLPGQNSGVAVRRPEAESDAADAAGPIGELVLNDADPVAPALERFAAVFDNSEGKPIVSVVLIDDGRMSDPVVAVAEIPFPVTVAIDPNRSGAADAMVAYRAAGLEVAAMPMLPPGARPTDVETTLEVAFSTLPEAIAIVDAGAGGWQGAADVTAQTVQRLAQDGRGFLTVSQGLNTGLRAAETEGVPAAVVYRDLDPDGQDARVIRRFLDQAAFRARQESGVVLLGRLRPDTLSALILWGTANRAGEVAMGPLSAVLGAE